MKLYINKLREHFNEEVTVKGFIDNIRDLQYVQFVILKDISGKIQITIEKNEENKELNEKVSGLTIDSTITVLGKVLENEKVKMGGMEIIPSSIEVTSLADQSQPINYKDPDSTLRETRLDWRFIDLRSEKNNLLFKCHTEIERAMREYWANDNYLEIHSPKITGASAEGGSTVFELDYFGRPACLSQSPQLYKQMVMASGFDKVFEIGQFFRAENSHTSYHATEILMVDMEISFIDSVNDVMDAEEAWIKHFMNSLKDKYGEDIKRLFNLELEEVNYKFPRITFRECKKILKEKYNYVAFEENDFERKEEELLCKYAKEELGSDFIFVTKYPYSARPFYTMKDENDSTLTESFDLLYKRVEITSGAQREHRYDVLKEQIAGKGLNVDNFNDYLNFFKYGCPPHGGLGFGLSRLIMEMFEIDNIREATLVYRGPNRLNP